MHDTRHAPWNQHRERASLAQRPLPGWSEEDKHVLRIPEVHACVLPQQGAEAVNEHEVPESVRCSEEDAQQPRGTWRHRRCDRAQVADARHEK